MSGFKMFWRRNFLEAAPAGFSLRVVFYHRWVRFHSLPESKRYADNDMEYEIILRRASTLASRVLGRGSDCWMVASYPNSEGEIVRYDYEIRTRFGLKESFFWTDPLEEPEDQFKWIAYSSACVWRERDFDAAIKRVADDIEPAVLWISKGSKAVFAPYDGGFDIILPTLEDVDVLSNEFSDWLSPHHDGF